MVLTVVFWNIWFDSQVNGDERSSKLLLELDNLVNTHNPDVIGLNEAVRRSTSPEPFVLEHLKKHGYKYSHFAGASFTTKDWGAGKDWEFGAALVSRYPIENIENIVLGKDTFAARRGTPEDTIKAIGASIRLTGSKKVSVIVAHPYLLRFGALRTHWLHQKALRTAVKKDQYQPVILGGDFNEPNILPGNFTHREKSRFYHRSGTYRNPTWRLNASRKTPLRFSLDKIFWTKGSNIELQDFKILRTDISDHSPLLARFEIK